MKLLFIADYHIDSYDFSKPKYSQWIGKVYDKSIEAVHSHIEKEKPDYIFFEGDLLQNDRIYNWEMQYLDKLFSFKSDAKKFLLSGNHEMLQGTPYKAYFWDSNVELLAKYGITYIKDMLHIKELDALVVGHGSIKSLETYRKRHKFLFTHLRWRVNQFITHEIDPSFADRFDNIVAGDIHFRYADKNIRFTGVPYDIHFKQEDSQPSILMWEDGEFTWLDTLKNKYRKKLIVCENVEEVLSLDIPNDTNWYKIKVTDTALNLKRLPKLPNVAYEKKSKELEAKEEIQFVKDAVTDLRTVSIEKSFIEFCELQNTRKECSDMLEAKIAGMEKIEDD